MKFILVIALCIVCSGCAPLIAGAIGGALVTHHYDRPYYDRHDNGRRPNHWR